MRGLVGFAFALLMAIAPRSAPAQDALAQLKSLHDGLAAPPGGLIPIEVAAQADEQLRQLPLDPAALPEPQKILLARTRLLIALGNGHAAAAASALEELQQLAGAAAEHAPLIRTAALAIGDAALVDALLRKERESAPPERQKALATQLRQLRKVGMDAPDVEVKTDDGQTIHLRNRQDAVLVLDFWNTRQKTDAATSALKALHAAYQANLNVQFLGVNSDSATKVDDARKFARTAGLAWPQHYERRSTDAPLTHRGFGAGAPPWQVIVDKTGVIRFVGDATEPAFQYALRAAIFEASGRYPPVTPAPATERPPPRIAREPARKPDEPKTTRERIEEREAREIPKGELPTNPDAASMLRQARAYIKTGRRSDARALLEDIINRFPETREARDAQELLRSL